jgi:transcriptional regulator with XRE-family HTH domain
MNQKELASALKKTEPHISAVIRGKTKPSVKLAKNLEGLTGIHWTAWIEPTVENNPYHAKALGRKPKKEKGNA